MSYIAEIIEVLERDAVLEVDNEEHTYPEHLAPVPVDWDRVFPPASSRETEEDWPLDPDLERRILQAADRPVPRDSMEPRWPEEDGPLGPWPEDIQRGERPIWEFCAWYQPIHFFAYDWGIYIREDCLQANAVRLARFLDPQTPALIHPPLLARSILRASFATLFLHEHFHHKVESFGLRLHVTRGPGIYPCYKHRVYRPNYLTDDCLEEAMANADAYRRLSYEPYRGVLGKAVLDATQRYLRNAFRTDPPGYRQAVNHIKADGYYSGLNLLQGQIKEARLAPVQLSTDWDLAPQLTRSLFNLKSDIYTLVPRGGRSIFPSRIFPRTCSTQDMTQIYQSRGYQIVPGGKGSHLKLKKSGCPAMILPGHRRELSAAVLKNALDALGGYSLPDLDNLLATI
ncbi:MAG: hypothetical protein WAT23_00440 [Chromatiaceae bacterium]